MVITLSAFPIQSGLQGEWLNKQLRWILVPMPFIKYCYPNLALEFLLQLPLVELQLLVLQWEVQQLLKQQHYPSTSKIQQPQQTQLLWQFLKHQQHLESRLQLLQHIFTLGHYGMTATRWLVQPVLDTTWIIWMLMVYQLNLLSALDSHQQL